MASTQRQDGRGETIEQAAEREVFEETGYKNKAGNLLSVQTRQDVENPSKNKVIFWFYCALVDDSRSSNTQAQHEDFSGRWFAIEEAISVLSWDNDKKLVRLSVNFTD